MEIPTFVICSHNDKHLAIYSLMEFLMKTLMSSGKKIMIRRKKYSVPTKKGTFQLNLFAKIFYFVDGIEYVTDKKNVLSDLIILCQTYETYRHA